MRLRSEPGTRVSDDPASIEIRRVWHEPAANYFQYRSAPGDAGVGLRAIQQPETLGSEIGTSRRGGGNPKRTLRMGRSVRLATGRMRGGFYLIPNIGDYRGFGIAYI